jgi:polar amino acid transport system permease protein
MLLHVNWPQYFPALLQALGRTVEFTLAGLVGSVLLGMALALMRVAPVGATRTSAAAYTEIIKNLPLLTLIFIIYYGLASVGLVLGAFVAGALALSLFYGAYLSEIFRAGLLGVSRGQREAAQSLGLRGWQVTAYVVLPQALRLALPGTATMFVDLLKSTSLLVTIAGAELMTEGQIITSVTFEALEVYVVIGLIYFALCYPLSQGVLWCERQLRRGAPFSPRRRRLLRKVETMLERPSPRMPPHSEGS